MVAVNMMGTMVMVGIAVLSLLLKEGFLVDICLIYAMISFLAVIVITKIYVREYIKEHQKEVEEDEHH
ncbi:MAG TPA: MrpF/PhaF family protein [Lachnospiraceae bacterium]|nr:MrpF/PhaF family protein [Lachnospiraceae bacterium]